MFPSLHSERFGGLQNSGRDALESLIGRFGPDGAQALFYNRGESKMAAVLSAFRLRQARRLLIWHLQLAKLRFLSRPDAQISVFLHGIEAWRRQDRLTRIALRRVHLFLSNSDYTWNKFVEWNPEFAGAQHRTVHLGIGSEGETPVAPRSDPAAVLMVGRLQVTEDYKGHREMIGAWPMVLKAVPGAELWIAGDGDLRPSLEALSRSKGVDKVVRFHGYISDEEKTRLLQRCRCLALPSTREGFGLVYLEAMQMGRPCLVSTQDAGREVVNPPEAGLAVDPADPSAIAFAVSRLLAPGSEWEDWSRQARFRHATQFTKAHFQQRLLSALLD